MPSENFHCPKCKQQMEPGYIVDRANRGAAYQSGWSAGEPEPRLFFLGGIKWYRRDYIPIVVYRCAGCGFLESYARGIPRTRL